MASPFVHLHTHSSYSPMSGVPTLEALCQAVRAQGQDTLALTDTNGLYGAIRFLDVARAAGLKPILGAELIHQHAPCGAAGTDTRGLRESLPYPVCSAW